MILGKTSAVGRQLEALWSSGTLTGMSDAKLLSRFAGVKDATAEAAFRELMDRHGPMVMGVCRQILGQPTDADDAFQATFLVLVRKAGSIRVGDSLAPWLYAVAFRTAHRARTIAARYRSAPVENLEDTMASPPAGAGLLDVRPLLHEELNRLPGKYRDPIVLCHLEGKTHEEAARLLHWPIGTVSGRLSRGRELLRSRLKRRGLEVSPAVLAGPWLAEVPTSIALPLIESTVGAAMGIAGPAISASVLALAQGVLNTMLVHKIKTIALAVVLVGGITGAAGVWGMQASKATKQGEPADQASPPPSGAAAAVPPADPGGGPEATVRSGADLPGLPALPGGGPVPGKRVGYPETKVKNAPKIERNKHFVQLRTDSMVLVQSPDRTAWMAMSLQHVQPQWATFKLPRGTTAEPVAAWDVAALAIKGKTISTVAAFSTFRGTWIPQTLLKPVEEEINPAIGPGWALYQAGNDFYAFSAAKGSWSVLHLEGPEEASVNTTPTDLEVLQGNKLYVFVIKQGVWSQPVEIYRRPEAARPAPGKSTGGQKPAE
jgi:RNA polymerase sigma factor (sigma-70 family)